MCGALSPLSLLLLWAAITEPFIIGNETIKGEMTPKDPIILEGDTLNLTCTVISPKVDASCLFFQFGNDVIDDQYVERGPPGALAWAKLRWPNIPKDYSYSHVYCYCQSGGELGSPGPPLHVGHVSIQVYRKPLKPKITGCIVYNWQRMECKWEPSEAEQQRHTGLATNQTLYWTVMNLSECPELHKCMYSCPHPSKNMCQWRHPDYDRPTSNFHIDSVYWMLVFAAHDVASTSSPSQNLTQFSTKYLASLLSAANGNHAPFPVSTSASGKRALVPLIKALCLMKTVLTIFG